MKICQPFTTVCKGQQGSTKNNTTERAQEMSESKGRHNTEREPPDY